MFAFEQGQKVMASLSLSPGIRIHVFGEVVGQASTGIEQTYIIKCMDGFVPNEVYPFDTFVMPLSLIEKV